MEIVIDNNGTTVLTTRHRDRELQWPTTALWMKLGTTTTASVYGALNEYWATLPMPVQDNFFALYAEAYEAIEEESRFEPLQAKATEIVTDLLNLVDHDHLSQWMRQYGNIAYNADIRDAYTGEYPRRQTYLREEYDELCILSMYFKMVTPIWGMFLNACPGLDAAYKELVTYELLDHSIVHQLPAMDRLKDYCEALAEKDSKTLTPAVVTYMGTNEIPRYYLAMVVVRRISIGEFRDPDKTLIKVAYKFLESKAKNLSNGVRDKRGGRTDTDEQESVAERYRISQSVPDYAVVSQSVYIEDTQSVVTQLNPQGSVKKAEAYIKALLASPHFSIAGYHLPIIGLVCKRVIYPRTCRLLSRDAFIQLIGITAAWLSDNGYQEMANLMISSRSEKDLSSVDIYAVGGYTFSPLSKENRVALEALYPYQQHDVGDKSLGNPGVIMIDAIIGEINLYDWPDRGIVPMNLPNDLANLIRQTEDHTTNTL